MRFTRRAFGPLIWATFGLEMMLWSGRRAWNELRDQALGWTDCQTLNHQVDSFDVAINGTNHRHRGDTHVYAGQKTRDLCA